MNTWTKPFYGVEHLETQEYLCTVVNWGKFTDVNIYRKPVRISDSIDNTFYGNNHLQDAKDFCEKYIH